MAELWPGIPGAVWLAATRDGSPAIGRRIPRRGADDAALDALEAAARWSAGLEHEALLPVLGHERDDDELVVISAYQEGEPLRTVLRLAGMARKPVPAPVALRIAHDLLGAVAVLNGKRYGEGLVRAALSPDNVLVASDGRTWLLEAGLSMVAAGLAPWSTDPKRAAYDAPEAFDEGASLGREADVFSTGVLLWEMLKNRPLFHAATLSAVRRRVLEEPVRRADALKPVGGEPIAAGVADRIEQALARDPDDRFVSAAEMRATLEAEEPASHEAVAAFLAELAAGALAKQRRHVQQLASTPPPPSSPPRRAAPSSPPRRRPLEPGPFELSEAVLSADPPGVIVAPDPEAPPVPSSQPPPAPSLRAEPRGPAGGPPPPPTPEPREPLPSEDIAAAIAETLEAAASAPGVQMAPAPDPSDPAYSLFSIADDPSDDDELPPQARAALERARRAERRRRWPLLALAALIVLISVVVAVIALSAKKVPTPNAAHPEYAPGEP